MLSEVLITVPSKPLYPGLFSIETCYNNSSLLLTRKPSDLENKRDVNKNNARKNNHRADHDIQLGYKVNLPGKLKNEMICNIKVVNRTALFLRLEIKSAHTYVFIDITASKCLPKPYNVTPLLIQCEIV